MGTRIYFTGGPLDTLHFNEVKDYSPDAIRFSSWRTGGDGQRDYVELSYRLIPGTSTYSFGGETPGTPPHPEP